MSKFFNSRVVLVLACALLVLTAGCTDAGDDVSDVEEPESAEAGTDTAEEERSDDGAETTDADGETDANAATDDDDGDGTDSEGDGTETDDGDGVDASESDGATEGDDDGSDVFDTGEDETDGAGEEEGDDGQTDDADESAGGTGDADESAETEESDETNEGEDESEPPAFVGSEAPPETLHAFPGHDASESPDVTDAESFEAELVDRGVASPTVEDGENVTVEYVTAGEDGWEPAIEEMGAVSAAYWGLIEDGSEAQSVAVTVTDADGEALFTYEIERGWLTEYLESIEEIENGEATSPEDPSEAYAEAVWNTIEVQIEG